MLLVKTTGTSPFSSIGKPLKKSIGFYLFKKRELILGILGDIDSSSDE